MPLILFIAIGPSLGFTFAVYRHQGQAWASRLIRGRQPLCVVL